MVKTLSRSALLARELIAAIARRELQPGDPIDIQALGRQHGVSRTVVREALADLGGKGLVVARPKVGTTVAPASHWNLLDPALVAVAIIEADGATSMLGEALAMRCVIEPALAADAARDASRAQRARILGAVRALAGAVGSADRSAHAEADAALHEAIADACANRLLRSADRALAPVRALCRERLHAQAAPAGQPHPEAVRALALQTGLGVAIARRDAPAAAACALTLSRLGCLPDTQAAVPNAAVPSAAVPNAAVPNAAAPNAAVPNAAVPNAAAPNAAAASLPAETARRAPADHVARDAALPDRLPRALDVLHGESVASTVTHSGADWPETAMLVPHGASITPLRRGRFDTALTWSHGDPYAAPRNMPATDPVDR